MGDARSVKLPQKVNLKLMLGCTITLMESGHLGGQDMADTVLAFMDARSVKLLQKVNLKLMLGCTITHTEYGQHGTLDTILMDLLFTDARREKLKLSLKLMPKPRLTTSWTEYGQPGTLDTTVLMDGNGDTLLANYFLVPPNHDKRQSDAIYIFQISALLDLVIEVKF